MNKYNKKPRTDSSGGVLFNFQEIIGVLFNIRDKLSFLPLHSIMSAAAVVKNRGENG